MKTLLTIQYVAPSTLIPDPCHSRRIADDELDRLVLSIRSHGFSSPVVALRKDRMVIDGHHRLIAARKLGLESVPVIFLDLPVGAARLFGLALNRIRGDFDDTLVARLLTDIGKIPGMDLATSGFPADEIRRLLLSLGLTEKRQRPEYFDLDAALAEATREPRAKPGDVWGLRDHRLLCGDATDPLTLERLLDGTPADMVFTDPPYNVDLGHHGGQRRGARRRPMANDALEPDAWAAFLRAWIDNILRSVEGAIYICMSCKEWPTLSRIMAEAGAHWSATVIWKKDRFVIGRADYQHGFEPLWYGWREGATRHWSGGRDVSDVWEISRPSDSPLHPATKPLALMERAIDNSSRVGDRVLDPFVGSGSTLIACERSGRMGLGIELDPVLVDVVIRRWERFSGETAVREEDRP